MRKLNKRKGEHQDEQDYKEGKIIEDVNKNGEFITTKIID